MKIVQKVHSEKSFVDIDENQITIVFRNILSNAVQAMDKRGTNWIDSYIEMCSTVPFGHCICDRAARYGKIIFTDCINEEHENLYEGVVPHGHYIVPIKLDERVIGVLLLYLNEGQKQHEREEMFLESIADTLVGMIKRKQAEKGLREQEVSLRAMYDAVVNVALITTDLGGESTRILDFSPGAEQIFGYSKDEIIREPIFILHPREFINQIITMQEDFRRG
jgi:PAS domain-containing protein